MAYPVKGRNENIRTRFGVTGDSWSAGWHTGVDLGAVDTDVIVPAVTGTVVDADWGADSYGDHQVIVKDSKGRLHGYMHMDSKKVSVGDRVQAGVTELGSAGAEGNTTGIHLHYEVRVSPYRYPADCIDPTKFFSAVAEDTGTWVELVEGPEDEPEKYHPPQSPQNAVAWAHAMHGDPFWVMDNPDEPGDAQEGDIVPRKCALFVARAYGYNRSGTDTANQLWPGAEPPGVKTTLQDAGANWVRKIPLGAIIYFSGTSDQSGWRGDGHVVICVSQDGDCWVASTDFADGQWKDGVVGVTPLMTLIKAQQKAVDPNRDIEDFYPVGWMKPYFPKGEGSNPMPPPDNSQPVPVALPDEDGGSSGSGEDGSAFDIDLEDFSKVRVTEPRLVRFNPPLPLLRRTSPDWSFTGDKIAPVAEDLVRDPSLTPGEWPSFDTSQHLRGYIVRDYSFSTDADGNPVSSDDPFVGPEGKKYGFGFLFNPTKYGESWAAPNDQDPVILAKDAASGNTAFTGGNVGLQLDLFLSRIDDMRVLTAKNWKDYYSRSFSRAWGEDPALTAVPQGIAAPESSNMRWLMDDLITEEDRANILRLGTLWDLEFLFRVANGKPQKIWRAADYWDKTSADFGMLLPQMVQVRMGVRMIRGIIEGVDAYHTMFTKSGAPILTNLTVKISRIIDAGSVENVNEPDEDADSGDDGGEESP